MPLYTVCHFVCIFQMHYCMVEPNCSNVSLITAIVFGCPYFYDTDVSSLQISAMGFDPEMARRALFQSRADIERALEIIMGSGGVLPQLPAFPSSSSGSSGSASSPSSGNSTVAIIREYHMRFGLSPAVSTRDSIINPRALAWGLIMVEGWY